jgi:hypothetical protein
MRIPGPLRRLKSYITQEFRLMSPNQPRRAFRPAWWALVGGPARTPAGHGPTIQQPAAQTRNGDRGEEYNGRSSRWWRRPWVGSIGGIPTYLSARRTGSRPDIVTTLGGAQPPVRLVQHQALSAPQPAVTANSPALATRVRVVLLPHTRTEPTDTRTNNGRTVTVKASIKATGETGNF